MGGEQLKAAKLDERGMAGDRWFAVRDAEGFLASGKVTRRFRRRDEVVDFQARTEGFSVEVSGNGQGWLAGSELLDSHLSERMGTPVQVLPEADVPHQDGGQVSLIGTATPVWCAERWGVDADPRRLRVNLVIETSKPFVEECLIGRELIYPLTRLHLGERIPRCRTTDLAQDGAVGGASWLKALGGEREGCLGVYATVVTPGSVMVGDQGKLAR